MIIIFFVSIFANIIERRNNLPIYCIEDKQKFNSYKTAAKILLIIYIIFIHKYNYRNVLVKVKLIFSSINCVYNCLKNYSYIIINYNFGFSHLLSPSNWRACVFWTTVPFTLIRIPLKRCDFASTKWFRLNRCGNVNDKPAYIFLIYCLASNIIQIRCFVIIFM